MNQAVQKAEPQEATPPQDSVALVQAITQAASNPDFNADTMRALLDAHREVMDRRARDAFYDAMNRVQARLPQVLPDSRNEQTHSDYASLKAIAKAIRPVYTSEGFSASFWEGDPRRDGWIRIEGVLRHKDGHSEPYHLELPPDKTGIAGKVNKTDVHAAGSTFTYGRRYLTCMMFDVATGEDNDGNDVEEMISPAQVTEINDLIAEIKLPEARKKAFLKWAKANRVEEISAEVYADAVRHLKELRDETNS